MVNYYTDEKNIQIVIALLKKHNISKVIASPGTTNMTLVTSLQNDSYFEMYSSVDERSAAYIACGLAAESGEPVVLSCTGATASRNYLSGLTEAYYRKLPILAITSTQNVSKISHNMAQVIDRSSIQNDVAKLSITVPTIEDNDDFWSCEVNVNKAILELKRKGGGPVHINLVTTYCQTYNTKTLPNVRTINRITPTSKFPQLPLTKIAIFVGAHSIMNKEQTEIIDKFCASNNAVVFCDHTSNYKGKYRVLYSIVACQKMLDNSSIKPNILIHIGEISGDYYTLSIGAQQVWKVSEDGEIRDTLRKLNYIFEMPEQSFFTHYCKDNSNNTNTYLQLCNKNIKRVYSKIPELPFSNIWIASKMANKIPDKSTIHFGILNSLRSWNFFELPKSVNSSSNVGGFGIDGNLSSIIGASLANKNKLYFGILGDLAFFYDMNVLGNRHVGNNIRILLINNGKGTEFRNYNHPAYNLGDAADEYIAAAGHFGNKSNNLVKHYAQDLGFDYFNAHNKKEFELNYEHFLSSSISERPMLFEVFINSKDESEALKSILNIEVDVKEKVKVFTKKILGQENITYLKNIIKK